MSAFATLITGAAVTAPLRNDPLQDTTQQGTREMDVFLAGVERKAFAWRILHCAMKMMRSTRCRTRCWSWCVAMHNALLRNGPLFHRILENRIRDMQRHRSVRGRLLSWVPWNSEDADEGADPIAQAPDPGPGPQAQLHAEDLRAAMETRWPSSRPGSARRFCCATSRAWT